MILYHFPGSCSFAVRILLEEIGVRYEVRIVNLRKNEQIGAEYRAINPKAKIPALVRDDGSVITEFGAIVFWLAKAFPRAQLLPSDIDAQARAMEIVEYVVGTVHAQGFLRMWFPRGFSPSVEDGPKVQKRGRKIYEDGLSILDAQISNRGYALGDYSIADVALFYVEYWAVDRYNMKLPANCAAHYRRMLDRPAVKKVIDEDRLMRPLFTASAEAEASPGR